MVINSNNYGKRLRMNRILSVFLVLVIAVMGITTLNNYDKMRAMQSSVEYLRAALDNKDDETITVSGDANSIEEISDSVLDEDITEKEEEEPEKTISTIQEMSENIYIVEQGDTLAKISKKIYGDVGHVDAICQMNGLSDGNLIFIGQKLLLP